VPLYEYRCDNCGVFDQWRTMAESSNPAHCPACEAVARRVFSAPAVMLTGSLRLSKKENPEPQLVKRDREPKPEKFRSHKGDRPWMISH
jgi:putative FmdB family regulatory protein